MIYYFQIRLVRVTRFKHPKLYFCFMIISEVIYTTKLRTESKHVRSGTTIITDAPVDNHGKGEAFSPTDLMATSLADCMLTIMGIAGNTHGFSIDGTKANVTKVMADNPRRVAEIHVELFFPANDYSDKNKKIIEHISKTCPVSLSLHSDVKQIITIHF